MAFKSAAGDGGGADGDGRFETSVIGQVWVPLRAPEEAAAAAAATQTSNLIGRRDETGRRRGRRRLCLVGANRTAAAATPGTGRYYLRPRLAHTCRSCPASGLKRQTSLAAQRAQLQLLFSRIQL